MLEDLELVDPGLGGVLTKSQIMFRDTGHCGSDIPVQPLQCCVWVSGRGRQLIGQV